MPNIKLNTYNNLTSNLNKAKSYVAGTIVLYVASVILFIDLITTPIDNNINLIFLIIILICIIIAYIFWLIGIFRFAKRDNLNQKELDFIKKYDLWTIIIVIFSVTFLLFSCIICLALINKINSAIIKQIILEQNQDNQD